MQCEGCSKEGAELQCPKCKELGLPPSLFCGQECFKTHWGTHKAKHSKPLLKSMNDVEKALFKFTGSVLPGLISPPRVVPKGIPRPDYVGQPDGSSALEDQAYSANRMAIWKGEDLACMREIARLSREILEVAMSSVKPGVTTDEIDRIVHDATLERGLYPSTLGYNNFKKSVCTSVNEIICHGVPDSRELLPTDILNIDVSAFGTKGGFHGDLNETIFVSREAATSSSIRLLEAGYAAMMEGGSLVKPGTLYKHLGDAIEAKCASYGYTVVKSICGHGIGRLFHCPPVVPHYANSRAAGVMKAGHVFTIEPMVCEGSAQDILWPDGWTIATKDGKRCSMFEQMFLVTEGGREIITAPEGYRPFFQRQLEQWGITETQSERDAAVVE
jgi:methionyl aminopeptidase